MKTFSNSNLTRSSQSNLSKDIPKHLNSEYGKLKKAKFNSTTSLIGSSKPNRNYTGNDSIVSKPDIQRSSLKKTGSTGNILPRRTHVPPQINQPIKFQWKKTNTNDHLIGNSKEGFEKDLPRTSYYKQNVSQVDRKQLKQDLIALSEHVREQVNLQPPTTLFYNFLLSHCFKLVYYMRKTNVDVNKIGIRLKELANDSVKNDLQPVLEAWASVQEIYMEEAMKRDTVIDGLMREFERMEEYNNLFKDFVEQRAAYPENKVIQIEVKQVFKQIQNIQVKEEVLHEEVIQTNITAEKIHDEIEKETQSASTQTEYNAEFDTKLVKVLEYDRSNIDLMDKATGPDREIPVYRNIGVFADLRHPVEDKYDELKVEYSTLERQTEMLKIEVEHKMDEMRKFYEGQLEGANLSSETEIKKLQGTIDVLQAENDRLEFELTTTTTDRSTKELELQAIRQQMAIVGHKLFQAQESDKILKQEKAEFVEKISNLQEQVYDLQISEATAVERAADFQKENEIITEEKEHLSQELRRVSVLLKETQDAFEQKTQSEAKLTILLEEKTSENEILKLEKERLEMEEKRSDERKQMLTERNEELEKQITVLMKFPDDSLGESFSLNDPPMNDKFMDTLHHMIEHNNLRISLLEQRNNKYRDILLKQAQDNGHSAYLNYNPMASASVIFNADAIKKSRPTTADSTNSRSSIDTYIIGSRSNSRPVSACTIRLLRPKSSKSQREKIQDSTLVSTLKNGQIEISRTESLVYPPIKLPFVKSHNPLAIYDNTILEEACLSTIAVKPKFQYLQDIDGKEIGRDSCRSRPPSSASYRWSFEDYI